MIYLTLFFNCIVIDLPLTQLKHSDKDTITHLGDNPQGEYCADIQPPDGNNGTCVFSDQCSKVTCTSPPDSTGPFGHMVITVQVYGCQPLTATVTMETYQSSMKWSHTFEDGEQAPLPMQVPAGTVNVTLFLQAELKKVGGKMHYKVLWKAYHYMRESQCVLAS